MSPDAPTVDLQQLWYAVLRRRAWSTLAVIPAHAGASAVPLAHALARVAELHLGQRVSVVVPGERCSLDELPALVPALAEREPAERRESGNWDVGVRDAMGMDGRHAALRELDRAPAVIVALESVMVHPLGVAVASAADAALLCITLGETPVASARRTIELVGRDRFIGCVVWRH
jgi:hypothetical protein